MSIDAKKFSQLLLHLYEAAEEPKHWERFLNTLNECTGAQGSALLLHDLKTGTGAGAWGGYDPAEIKLYSTYYSSVNPWMPKTPADVWGGPVLIGEVGVPLARLRMTEFYNDWGKRNDVVFSIATSVHLDPTKFIYLCLNRGDHAGPHPRETIDLAASLIPHMERGFAIHERLRAEEALNHSFHWMDVAVFLLEKGGRVLEMTPRAQELVEAKDGLLLDQRFLHAAHQEDKQPFLRILAETIRSSAKMPGMIRIRREPPRSDHVVAVVPVTATRTLFPAEAGRCLVFVLRPDSPDEETDQLDSPLSFQSQ